MKNRLKITIGAGVAFALLMTVIATAIIYSQRQTDESNPPQVSRQNKDAVARINELNKNIPVADYDEPLPRGTEEKALRERRNKARNIKEDQPGEAKRFMLTEERESFYGSIPKHARVEPAIPAKQSDAVIVGEITDATAHLSEDRVSIYSEFEVGNLEIFKNITSEKLSLQEPIIVSRGGGGVRFSSGKVIYNWLIGKPMPEVGKKYLFFLKHSNEIGFSIITAYELRQEQVFPLDGETPEGNTIRLLAGYQSFKGSSETDFLNQVKEAIGNSSDVLKKE